LPYPSRQSHQRSALLAPPLHLRLNRLPRSDNLGKGCHGAPLDSHFTGAPPSPKPWIQCSHSLGSMHRGLDLHQYIHLASNWTRNTFTHGKQLQARSAIEMANTTLHTSLTHTAGLQNSRISVYLSCGIGPECNLRTHYPSTPPLQSSLQAVDTSDLCVSTQYAS